MTPVLGCSNEVFFFGGQNPKQAIEHQFLCANQFPFASRNLDFVVEFIVRFHPEGLFNGIKAPLNKSNPYIFCHFVLSGFAEGLVSRCEIYHSFQESSRYTSPDHKSCDLDPSKSQVPCCISRWFFIWPERCCSSTSVFYGYITHDISIR